ncbi:hypothetical protein CO046_01495 [Candidatus Peregrinibacteria bacterium CG_4_9_14_0_2_um_filter_53_11]|nr:MAG: hypothetical protein CO046_01495 [Candidatus Peregrinibacteria bacterium CG_4_9_14_0_2_um_filter_53_11]
MKTNPHAEADSAPFKLALLCGGPSPERGISLNSARSLCDHLHGEEIEVVPFYFDARTHAYGLKRSSLYSNTPSDFDFKLSTNGQSLSEEELLVELAKCDLIFPVMHGKFGEDGQIQELLERNALPFVGSSAEACQRAFDKYSSHQLLESVGLPTVPNVLLEETQSAEERRALTAHFFEKESLHRAVVKPARGGSSIGVTVVESAEEAVAAAAHMFETGLDSRVVIQPFLQGIEFTCIVMAGADGKPVALMPTEIELDYTNNAIFDYRKKYLPTRSTTYHCPPRFDDEIVETIQGDAEKIFAEFGMRDFARLDGWVLADGRVCFTDLNPLGGMEQNSFVFQQAAHIGMSHRDFLRLVIERAAVRQELSLPPLKKNNREVGRALAVRVLFGGSTAERQVSVMSGTNAWLKLRTRPDLHVTPYLLAPDGRIWQIPYYAALHHTVEEIVYACEEAVVRRERTERLRTRVVQRLKLTPDQLSELPFLPTSLTLEEFVESADFVFLGLHGGLGEDGRLQRMLEEKRIPFNGSGSTAAALCMDKYKTGEYVTALNNPAITTAPKVLRPLGPLFEGDSAQLVELWNELAETLETDSVIVKPHNDGCSAGIVRLSSAQDLETYLTLLKEGVPTVTPHTFPGQDTAVEMPTSALEALLFEAFIVTDRVRVVGSELEWERRTGWVEVTVGVLGSRDELHALSPSITVAMGHVLSLEEKFQGGTGVNITPPPPTHVPLSVTEKVKAHITEVARALGIEGYARLDAFMNVETGEVIIIEANVLPALTPSTVIFHQALSELRPLYPAEFLEHLVELGQHRYE